MKKDKKKDIIDGMLELGILGSSSSGVIEPIQFSDYPETVLTTLRLFYKIWKFPSGAIPSKKNKGTFEQWINELNELNDICPSSKKMEKAMELALGVYETARHANLITHPLSIKKYLIHAVGEINRHIEENQSEKEPETPMSPEAKEKAIKRFEKLLEENERSEE